MSYPTNHSCGISCLFWACIRCFLACDGTPKKKGSGNDHRQKITGSHARKTVSLTKSSQTFLIHFLSRLYRILGYNPELAVNRKSRALKDAPLLSNSCRKTYKEHKKHTCRILRYTLSKLSNKNKIKNQIVESRSMQARTIHGCDTQLLYGAIGPTVSEDGSCRASDTRALQGYVQLCMRSTLCSGDRHTTGIPTKS